MAPIWGVHAGLQNTSYEELRDLWSQIEELGFEWISVWDHFYSSDLVSTNCLEAVATHTALASNTTKVRCGSLVYSAGYRHPAVLANAIATIDHVSGGRADLGLGAGWAEPEYRAYGIPFPPAGIRLNILEEAAACIRSLLRDDSTTFEGEHFTLTDAVCDPKPVQAELPLWIGGGGERRTLRIAAQYADGWNIPFVPPDEFARKREVLGGHCVDLGRDMGEIRCTVNVGVAIDDRALEVQFGPMSDYVRPGILMGSPEQMVDRVGEYVEAGADQINVALRAPFDRASLEHLASAVGLSS